jgi:hypothetical protein
MGALSVCSDLFAAKCSNDWCTFVDIFSTNDGVTETPTLATLEQLLDALFD